MFRWIKRSENLFSINFNGSFWNNATTPFVKIWIHKTLRPNLDCFSVVYRYGPSRLSCLEWVSQLIVLDAWRQHDSRRTCLYWPSNKKKSTELHFFCRNLFSNRFTRIPVMLHSLIRVIIHFNYKAVVTENFLYHDRLYSNQRSHWWRGGPNSSKSSRFFWSR